MDSISLDDIAAIRSVLTKKELAELDALLTLDFPMLKS